jgi:pimeloyl-ACP methyl ester carboxylesterase
MGTPVVFIHGGFPSLAMKLENLQEWTWEEGFARHFHFVWYDRRGCWRSPSPAHGYELGNQARDLASVLDHLDIDAAHLVGSSAGGPIAMAFAARWPRRTRSLVLAGTGMELFPESDPVSDLIRDQIAVLDDFGAETAFERRPPDVETSFEILWRPAEEAARGHLDTYRERQDFLAEQARRLPSSERAHYFAVELRSMQAYMERDVRADARRIVSPTLVLHGSDDREVPLALGEEIARTIPGARLHVVSDGGHSLVHRTEEGRALAIQFIRRHESR